MSRKILVFSTQLGGGCFQYSNSIISNMEDNIEIVMPDKGCEEYTVIPAWTIKFAGHNVVIKIISLIYTLSKILYGAIVGKYSSIVLFGITKWDYYVLKFWRYTKLPSFLVIHDGKMHQGELNHKFQNDMLKQMKWATNLIFLSEYVEKLVKENYGIEKPCHIAPHGLIDYGQIDYKEQRDIPTLLFLGRVTEYKGIDTLLSAMEIVPSDCYKKLIIAGKWSRNMQEPHCHEKLEIINKHLTNDEILKYIEQTDVMLFPYKEATQSGVATLALNYIKPSIVTNVGAFKEQFTEKSAVFVEPENPIALANAIEDLCCDLDRRKRMQNGIAIEKQKFQWDNITHNLEYYIRTRR